MTKWLGVERRAHPSTDMDWARIFAGVSTAPSGVSVTVSGSLASAVVYACVRVLAESVAQLPLILYERVQIDGRPGKQRATGHPLYNLIHYSPNPEMTSFQWRETIMSHVLLWGNAFCEKEFDTSGRLIALWPLRPDKMSVHRVAGQLMYDYELDSGRVVRLPQARIHHLAGLSYDGVMGYSPIRLQMASVGFDLALEEHGGRFFGNGARPGGVLTFPGRLTKDAADRLRDSWAKLHEGLTNSQRVAILEEGMDYKAIGIPPEESQFLQTRQFQRSIIAGWYRVPAHMINDLERATFSNIEQQSINFVVHSIGPWLVRHEQQMWLNLLTPEDRQRYFAEYLVDGLLRGEINARYAAFQTALQNGFMNVNEVRERENLNPIDGGDVHMMPLNLAPLGEFNVELPAPTTPTRGASTPEIPESAPAREQRARAMANKRRVLAASYRRNLLDVSKRLMRREVADVKRAAEKMLKRGAMDFSVWLDDFYRDYESWAREQMAPTLWTYAELILAALAGELGREVPMSPRLEAFVTAYLETFAQRHVIQSREQIKGIINEGLTNGADPLPFILARLETWEDVRPGRIAAREASQFNNAVAHEGYADSSITRLIWDASGENCPYCTRLNGKVVGIEEIFVPGGTDFEPDGGGEPLKIRRNRRHPPLHEGCDCMIVAEI